MWGDLRIVKVSLTLRLRCRGVRKRESEGLERTSIVCEDGVIMGCCAVVDNEITRFAAFVDKVEPYPTRAFHNPAVTLTFYAARVWPFDPNGILRCAETKNKRNLILFKRFFCYVSSPTAERLRRISVIGTVERSNTRGVVERSWVGWFSQRSKGIGAGI